MEHKKILAIETSAELCSACLSLAYNKYDERNILMKHVHSEKLIPIIDELLKSNGISTSQLDCVSVSTGPGSFTGLRIGMTAAKGIAFASNLPIVPVPTFSAFSLELSKLLPDETNFAIITNANIDEAYFAAYKNENNLPKILQDLILIKKSEIDSQIMGLDVVYGNLKTVKNIRMLSSPKASSIAKWTYLFGEDLLTFEYDYLEPNYFKKIKFRKQS
jgi:tRNA threonylcarbamoyladenosine biosynthesis protein TsaB